jgi:hypothetical protein
VGRYPRRTAKGLLVTAHPGVVISFLSWDSPLIVDRKIPLIAKRVMVHQAGGAGTSDLAALVIAHDRPDTAMAGQRHRVAQANALLTASLTNPERNERAQSRPKGTSASVAHRIGTFASTILGVLFVPVSFVFIQRLSGRKGAQRQ